jgi:hypothetical protein
MKLLEKDEDNILVNNFIQNINSLSVKKLEELKKIITTHIGIRTPLIFLNKKARRAATRRKLKGINNVARKKKWVR